MDGLTCWPRNSRGGCIESPYLREESAIYRCYINLVPQRQVIVLAVSDVGIRRVSDEAEDAFLVRHLAHVCGIVKCRKRIWVVRVIRIIRITRTTQIRFRH